MILSRGAAYEPQSVITQPQLDLLRNKPEIVTDSNGAPLISLEVIAAFSVAPGDPKNQFVYLRGVKPIAYRVHRNMKLREGHWPDPNSGQWVVGQKLAAKYPQLQMGRTFHLGRRNWKSMRDQPDFVVDLKISFFFRVESQCSSYRLAWQNGTSVSRSKRARPLT